MHVKVLVEYLAAASGGASCLLWFWAAKLRIPWGGMATLGGPAPSVVRELNRQGKLNGWAALATGISALLQAIALSIPS